MRLHDGATGSRDPVFLFSAMGWDNNDLTGTYVEVSIQDQKLWCYKNGQVVGKQTLLPAFRPRNVKRKRAAGQSMQKGTGDAWNAGCPGILTAG